MTTRLALVFCFVSCFFNSHAQKEVFLSITHKLGDSPFVFNQEHTNNLEQTFTITRMDYYISSIRITHDGGQVLALDSNKHILVKAQSNVVEFLGAFDLDQVEAITFSIGVHPSLNHADPALQPQDSPLYFQFPTMHWGWASGYFFACLEGKAGVGFIGNYQLHGLWSANYLEQTIALSGAENDDNQLFLHLDADYKEALRDVQVVSVPVHHGSNQADLKVLENFRDYVFSAGTGDLLTVDYKSLADFQIYPNPTHGLLHISLGDFAVMDAIVSIYDVRGVLVQSVLCSEIAVVDLSEARAGMYYLFISNKGAVVHQQKIIVN